jgi:hypothetical protein
MFKDKIKVGNRITVQVTPLDARKLHLDTSNIAFINTGMDENDDHITSVSLEDKITIKKGDKFKLLLGAVNTIYEVTYMIVHQKGKSVIIYSSLPTKTELFLLPLLGKSKIQMMYDSYFVNAQLDYTKKYLCLTYRFTGTNAYKRFENFMVTDPMFISHLEHGKNHVVYIFLIPSGFTKDIELFIEGKYSKFSKALRKQIQKFHDADENKPLFEIMNRNKLLKKDMEKYLGVKLPANSELASKPNLKIEIYQPYEQ